MTHKRHAADPRLDGLPKHHARCATAGVVGNHRKSIDRLAEELHAEAFMKCDGIQICRCGYGLDVPAPMPSSELNEVTEKLVRQVLPASGRPAWKGFRATSSRQ